jgi:hypothetical protein
LTSNAEHQTDSLDEARPEKGHHRTHGVRLLSVERVETDGPTVPCAIENPPITKGELMPNKESRTDLVFTVSEGDNTKMCFGFRFSAPNCAVDRFGLVPKRIFAL